MKVLKTARGYYGDVRTIDERIVERWPFSVLLEQYTAYSVSVSAMEILFSSGNPTK